MTCPTAKAGIADDGPKNRTQNEDGPRPAGSRNAEAQIAAIRSMDCCGEGRMGPITKIVFFSKQVAIGVAKREREAERNLRLSEHAERSDG